MKLGSLFDGIGGFPLSAIQHDIEPVWASEVEPFPISVTRKHFPNMKHLGDITQINGAEIEPVEIITGGSPCQDLSVAGKRAGLAGARSGLFMEQVRIIKEMREHDRATGRAAKSIRPRYMVWENVPGAFSSNGGEDFRAVLEETARIADETITIPRHRDDKWDSAGAIVGRSFSIAWRVIDAQYWGVPQRRRRIFLVADFAGRSAGEILFKQESMSRDIAEGKKEGQATTEGIGTGAESTSKRPVAYGFDSYNQDAIPEAINPIRSASGGDTKPMVVVLNDQGGSSIGVENGLSPTLRAETHGNLPCVAVAYGVVSKGNGEAWVTPERHMALNTGGGQAGQGYPAVLTQEPKAYGICSDASNSMKSDNPHSGIYEADTTRTLDQNGGNPACNQGGMAIVSETVLFEPRSQDGVPRIHKDIVPTLNTAQGGQRQPCIANVYREGSYGDYVEGEFGTLKASGGVLSGGSETFVSLNYTVRRLTPTECERLQGFPDDWTNIPGVKKVSKEEIEFWRGVWYEWDKMQSEEPEEVKPRKNRAILTWLKNPTSDTAQYKALGNSIAVPCVTWIMGQIAKRLEGET